MIQYKCEIMKRGYCRVSRFYEDAPENNWEGVFKISENLSWLRYCFKFNLEPMNDGTVITIDDRGKLEVSDNLGLLKPGPGNKDEGIALPATERQRRWREKKKRMKAK